jgi:hypothetical protein
MTWSQGGEEYATYNKKEEVYFDWLHRSLELSFKHITEGKIKGELEMMGRRRRRRQLPNDIRVLETERICTRSHSLENSLWKRSWICRKTDYGRNKSKITKLHLRPSASQVQVW